VAPPGLTPRTPPGQAAVAVAAQPRPSAPAGAARPARARRRRFRGGGREWWGYGVWLLVGLVFATDVPFPTLYRTIAYLERRWRPAAMVIVAGLAVHLVFFPWPDILLRG
jgi:hypothetical protein